MRRFWGAAVALWAGMGVGCASHAGSAPAPKEPHTLKVETEDRNHDGKPDKWIERSASGEGGRTEKLDLDFDGKVDVIREYDAQGQLTLERRDLDYDGRIDDERIFRGGQLVEERSGFGFDGKFHHRAIFEDGKKVREEIDIDQDGKVDEWRYFENDKLVRIGTDTNGDGQPDSFRR